MSEFNPQGQNQEPKKQYDAVTGMMVTTEQSMKLEHDRVLYDVNEWHRVHDAPPPGIGLDGYPLQKGKLRDYP